MVMMPVSHWVHFLWDLFWNFCPDVSQLNDWTLTGYTHTNYHSRCHVAVTKNSLMVSLVWHHPNTDQSVEAQMWLLNLQPLAFQEHTTSTSFMNSMIQMVWLCSCFYTFWLLTPLQTQYATLTDALKHSRLYTKPIQSFHNHFQSCPTFFDHFDVSWCFYLIFDILPLQFDSSQLLWIHTTYLKLFDAQSHLSNHFQLHLPIFWLFHLFDIILMFSPCTSLLYGVLHFSGLPLVV